jgi:hypothetical protein
MLLPWVLMIFIVALAFWGLVHSTRQKIHEHHEHHGHPSP